jgi:glycosyltransferase involved in cell wall biosynthesis
MAGKESKRRRKRVLIVVENLPVPFDTRVWKEACALQQAGYQVCVICPAGKGYQRGYEFLEGVHVYRHRMPPEGNGAAGYLLEYGIALFWQKILAWKIFFKHGFDVIQGCNPPDNIFLIALPFKLFGVKYIFDHHDVNPELYYAKFGRKDFLYLTQIWLERLTFACANVVISTNHTYRQVAMDRGKLPPDDVFVVRNGPDLATFRTVPPRPELKYGKRYLVGYVGTMSEQEGLDILLGAARFIRDSGRVDIHFTCIGGGPGLEKLQAMKSSLGLDEMFNFTGRIPDRELLEILSTADICVNPDKPGAMNDMSTMIKIMEYMALGKPIVQFDLREGRFSAGEASLYADASDPIPNFAGKILQLLDSDEERQRRGELGRRRVETELAWEYSIPYLLAAYERALGR